jgi:drug/metabolite transporter (DMT)-like permease
MNKNEGNLDASELDALLAHLPQEDLLEALGDEAEYESSSRPGHRKAQSLFVFPTGQRKRGRHHRHKSSMGQLFDSISRELLSIAEGVQAEAQVLKGTFREELEDADRGKTFFLDMSMTRSMSVLPEDIQDLAEEATGVQQQDGAPPDASVAGRYASLFTAVLAVSSNGTALALLDGVNPALKLQWRMTATALVLSFFASRTLLKEGFPKLSTLQLFTLMGAIICFFFMTLLLYTALEYTSIGNAVIGANSQALLLILGKFLVGQKVLALEGLGVVVAFGGCILCSGDEASDQNDEKKASTALFGDMLAFASAAAGVLYLTFAKAVRSEISVTVFMFLVTSCGSLLTLFYLILSGADLSWSTDPHIGVFGWINLSGHRLWILIHVALVCNIMGTMGFVRAMQYFDNIIIAVATLLEPLTATLIAYSLHVGDLPGPLGWLGNTLVILGTLLVVYPSIDKPMVH